MEIRTHNLEVRREGNEVEGIASSVESTYDLGYFEETIARGAFDNVLNDDVVVLFNHDPNMVLGRTKSVNGKTPTAEIFVTDQGHLGYRYESSDSNQMAKDVKDMIDRGDVHQSSFAFTVAEEKWEWAERSGRDKDRRIITKIERLYDVSPVTYPANPNTSVRAKQDEELRSVWENAKEKREDKKDELIVKLSDLPEGETKFVGFNIPSDWVTTNGTDYTITTSNTTGEFVLREEIKDEKSEENSESSEEVTVTSNIELYKRKLKVLEK